MTGGSGRRKALLATAVLAVVFGGTAAFSFPRLPDLAERAAVEALSRAGFGKASLTVSEIGWGDVELSGLRLGAGEDDLSAGHLRVRFSPGGLMAHRVDAVEIEGLRLRVLRRADGGIAVPPLDPLPLGGEGASAGTDWVVERVVLNDAGIVVDAPEGRIEAKLKGEAEYRGGGAYEASLSLESEVSPAGRVPFPVSVSLHGRAGGEALGPFFAEFRVETPPIPGIKTRELNGNARLEDGQMAFDGDLTAAEGRVGLHAEGPLPAVWSPEALRVDAHATFDLSGLPSGTVAAGEADVALADNIVSLDLPFAYVEAAGQAARLRDLRAGFDLGKRSLEIEGGVIEPATDPAPSGPLRLSGRARQDEGGSLAFSARLSDPLGRMVVEAQGRHDPDTGKGHADVTLHPVTFAPGVLQPHDLFPVAGDVATEVSGRLTAKGPVRWADGGLSSDLDVRIEDTGFTVGGLAFQGVNGKVRVDRPWPLSTPPKQRVTVRHLTGPLPLDGIDLSFRVADGKRLLVEGLWARTADGMVSLGPVELPPGPERQEVVLGLSGLDLESLLTLFEVPDAEGRGKFYGALPLVLEDGRFGVADALIETDGRGVLRYRPAVPPAALQGGGQGASLMLSALENFGYETLRLTADRDPGGEWQARLHMKGANPDVLEGQPFEFNINLSGKLDEILRRSLEGMNLPETLAEKLTGATMDGK